MDRPRSRLLLWTTVVTVLAIVAPSAVCQDIMAQLDGSGIATILPQDLDGGSSDTL